MIESIADLNGSALLRNYPRTIDLRYNKLKKVNSNILHNFRNDFMKPNKNVLLSYLSKYANVFLLYLQFELSYVKSILKTTQGPSVDNYLFSNEDGFSCDCSDIKEVQRFLQDYAFIIRDAADIFCKEDNGNIIQLKSIDFNFRRILAKNHISIGSFNFSFLSFDRSNGL